MEAAEEAGHMNFNWNNFDQTFLRTQPVTYIRNEGVSQKVAAFRQSVYAVVIML